MSEMENDVMYSADGIEPILPEGWTEDSDIFADAEPNAFEPESTDAMDTTPAEEVETPALESAAETTEAEEPAETAPAHEPEVVPEETSNKLRFKYKYDREERDAELDEADLPDIYERALAVDRYKERVSKMSTTNEAAEKLAKQMGYGNADEMLTAAAENYRNSEIERMTSEGVHPEVAAAIVDGRLGAAVADRGQPAPQAPNPPAQQAERDFTKEAGDLLAIRPELRGHNLPEEVVRTAMEQGLPLVDAYLVYERKQNTVELERLRKENQIYKQNAEAAARSPVKGTSGGGSTDTKPTDPFIAGFNADY